MLSSFGKMHCHTVRAIQYQASHRKKSKLVPSQHSNASVCHNSSDTRFSLCADSLKMVRRQDLESEDASLVTGMLAPKHLDQLNEFLGAPVPIPEQIDEPSLTTSSLHGLSLGDKVATLSALQPSVAAAVLGKLCRCCHLDRHKGSVGSLHLRFRPACRAALSLYMLCTISEQAHAVQG
jgi:hypothetical protein